MLNPQFTKSYTKISLRGKLILYCWSELVK